MAFDDWGAVQMAQNLQGQDFEMIKFRQGYRSLSPPSKECMRLVLDEKLRHGGHPVLRWMFENVYIETDASGNIKPSKQKSREKIDGAVATIMALEGAIRPSVKQARGGIVVYDADTDTVSRNGEIITAPEKKETAEEKRRRIERETLFSDY